MLSSQPVAKAARSAPTATLTGSAAGRSAPGSGPAGIPRNPIDRWPVAAGAGIVVLAFLASVFVSARPGQDVVLRGIADVPLPAFIVFAVAAAALLRRRELPLLVLATVLVCSGVVIAFDYGQVGVAVAVSVYSLGRYAPAGLWTAGGLAATAAVSLSDAVTAGARTEDAAGGLVVIFLLWYAGRRVRLRGERAALLAREQAAQEGRVLAEERARIARELHDVVAHRVSLMTVQAGAARTVAAVDPQGAAQAMAAVEQAGREALGELRDLLGVLRPDRSSDELGPQPGLADVPRLIDQFREAGLAVSLEMHPVPTGLPARVDLFAYRIVQEAMTNVLKHAGPGANAEVSISTDHHGVTVDIADDGRGARILPGSGHGVVGMRERAQLLGGSLQAGPRPGGGFHVVAVLPAAEETA